jgi:hypothetical protein
MILINVKPVQHLIFLFRDNAEIVQIRYVKTVAEIPRDAIYVKLDTIQISMENAILATKTNQFNCVYNVSKMEIQHFVLNAHLDSEFKMEAALVVKIKHKIVRNVQFKVVQNANQDTFYKKMDLVKLVIIH